jgi:hypothetical protein
MCKGLVRQFSRTRPLQFRKQAYQALAYRQGRDIRLVQTVRQGKDKASASFGGKLNFNLAAV